MKLWAKGMLIAAAVCVGTGSALCVSGWAMGGRFSQFREKSYGITQDSVTPEDSARPPLSERGEESRTPVSDRGEEPAAEAAVFEGPPVYEGHKVTKLELSLAGGAAEVIWDDGTDSIQVICENDRYQCYQETDGDTLEIRISRKGSTVRSILDPETYEGWDETAAQILIPAGSCLKEAELEVGGGALTVTRLCADKLDLEVDAGKLEVLESSVGELEGQCRAGELIYEGQAKQKIEAECLAGAVKYLLEGQKEDFNYEIEVVGGSIQVDGAEQGKVKKKTVLDHPGAGKKAELECRAGAIKVDFYTGN